MSDLIDAYLDELLSRLHGPASGVRRTLLEAEAHLREAAEVEQSGGRLPSDAQLLAIQRFGSARAVAAAMNRETSRVAVPTLVRALAGQAARMVAVGLGAVAIAALLAQVLALLTSTAFVYGTPAGVALPAGRCSHWLAVQPSATTCARAAALERADDTTLFSIGGAVIGLVSIALLFGAAALLRRLRTSNATRVHVPAGVIPGIGSAVFGCAGVALLAAALSDSSLSGVWGRGLWFVDASVALVVALCYTVAFMRSLVRGQHATR